MSLVRVFPRKTAFTPRDDRAFVGDPPLFDIPECSEIHVSCTFTWDLDECYRLVEAWKSICPNVKIGGPALGNVTNDFEPGRYIMRGVTFTSRGCNCNCPWCLVPEREGKLRPILPIREGYIINDNNFLQNDENHRRKVYQMLNTQSRGVRFLGGIQASLVTDRIAEEFRGLDIHDIFLAADTVGALKPLKRAIQRLSFLKRNKLRCYVLVAFNGETLQQAEARLEQVWELGAMPFAQLYQPPNEYISYSKEWRDLTRTWSRPASMVSMHTPRKLDCKANMGQSLLWLE